MIPQKKERVRHSIHRYSRWKLLGTVTDNQTSDMDEDKWNWIYSLTWLN